MRRTDPVSGSIRATSSSNASVTHTAPEPRATSAGWPDRPAPAPMLGPATSALTDAPPVIPAKMGADLELGPACDQCGGMMQRTGSCYTCSSCGNNTGCG